jgi:hypothetical protein
MIPHLSEKGYSPLLLLRRSLHSRSRIHILHWDRSLELNRHRIVDKNQEWEISNNSHSRKNREKEKSWKYLMKQRLITRYAR